MNFRITGLCCLAFWSVMSIASSKPGAFADIDGLRLYYEIHGSGGGTPLVLIHGGGSSIDVTWGRILPSLAQGRRVIAIDEQAHGRSGDRPGPLSFERTADDVAGLLKLLGIAKADVFGFSNGASSALQVAIRHPDRVHKLVFASAMTKRDGAPPQLWEFMRVADISNMPQPLKDAFLAMTPDPSKLKNMHDKDAERMRNFRDLPDEVVRTVRAPTLILAGDRDVVSLDHVSAMARLFPGARVTVFASGHGDYLGELLTWKAGSHAPARTAEIVLEFLDSKD
jgi:pimeloyl-ACP methyl ester carboxylesterase